MSSSWLHGYRYTKDMLRLTNNQRAFYEKNGYLVFPGLVPQDVLDKCHKRYVYCADTKRVHQMTSPVFARSELRRRRLALYIYRVSNIYQIYNLKKKGREIISFFL